MKRILMLLLAMALAGCGGAASPAPASPSPAPASPSPEPSLLPPIHFEGVSGDLYSEPFTLTAGEHAVSWSTSGGCFHSVSVGSTVGRYGKNLVTEVSATSGTTQLTIADDGSFEIFTKSTCDTWQLDISRAAVASLAEPTPSVSHTATPTPTPVPTPTPKPTAPPTAQPTAKPWYPSGFDVILDDPPVAFRWLKNKEFKCPEYSTSCWGAIFIPQNGCSSLLITLSVEDDSGTVVGSANGMAEGVSPGQKAKIIFDGFMANGGSKAHVSQVYCD